MAGSNSLCPILACGESNEPSRIIVRSVVSEFTLVQVETLMLYIYLDDSDKFSYQVVRGEILNGVVFYLVRLFV